jgi:hypothetical protein
MTWQAPAAKWPVRQPLFARPAPHRAAHTGIMRERVPFLVAYIGSAAMAAFLAACLDAPRVATFTCETPPGGDEERCVLAETWTAARGDAPSARGADQVAVALQALN